MPFVILGVILVLMNVAGIGWPGTWTWTIEGGLLKLIWPFGVAAIWWAISDSLGFTQKRESDKIDAKREERRLRSLESLGLQKPRRRK